MNLQKTILERFREHFPKATFKEISQITGVQTTRVFRLFNGYEMKLKEYAAFEKVLSEMNRSSVDHELVTLTKDLLQYLDVSERRQFHLYLQREIYKNELKQLAVATDLRRQYV